MARKYCRASFQADSTASEPPEGKNTRERSPGARGAGRAASSVAGGARRQLEGGRVRVRPEREVAEGLDLRACGLRQLRAPVADLHGEQSREAVEQPMAGRVPHVATLTARDHVDRRVGVVRAEAREVHPEVTPRQLAQCGGVVRHSCEEL